MTRPLRRTLKTADALAQYREKRRDEKRRRRARLYAKGLTSTGKPVRFPEISKAARHEHPAGCPCYSCLWGDVKTAFAPLVHRMLAR